MKKYLFGILAVVLAIGFSAFTKPAKKNNKTGVYVFAITTSPTTEGIVSNLDNWSKLGLVDDDFSCPDQVDQMACQIQVDEQFTHLIPNTSTRILNSQAFAEQTGDAYGDNDYVELDALKPLGASKAKVISSSFNLVDFENTQDPD